MLLWLAIVAGPTSDEVDAALRRVVEAGSYQTALPGRTKAGPVEEPQPEEEFDSESRFDPPSRERQVIGKAVIWVLVGITALLVIAWIVGVVRQRVPRREPATVSASAPAELAAPVAPLSDAEALAHAQEWTEAIHATLLLVIADMTRRGLSPAWTSREILRRAKFPQVVRDPLRDLVVLVERSLFAGIATTEADYTRARECGLTCRKALAS